MRLVVALVVVMLAAPAAVPDRAAAGEDLVRLETVDGGLSVEALVRRVAAETGTTIFHAPDTEEAWTRVLGTPVVPRERLHDWLRAVLSWHGETLVRARLPGMWTVVDADSEEASEHPIVVPEAELESWSHRDGTRIVSLLTTPHLVDGAPVEAALGLLSSSADHTVERIPGARSLLVADDVRAVLVMHRVARALDEAAAGRPPRRTADATVPDGGEAVTVGPFPEGRTVRQLLAELSERTGRPVFYEVADPVMGAKIALTRRRRVPRHRLADLYRSLLWTRRVVLQSLGPRGHEIWTTGAPVIGSRYAYCGPERYVPPGEIEDRAGHEGEFVATVLRYRQLTDPDGARKCLELVRGLPGGAIRLVPEARCVVVRGFMPDVAAVRRLFRLLDGEARPGSTPEPAAIVEVAATASGTRRHRIADLLPAVEWAADAAFVLDDTTIPLLQASVDRTGSRGLRPEGLFDWFRGVLVGRGYVLTPLGKPADGTWWIRTDEVKPESLRPRILSAEEIEAGAAGIGEYVATAVRARRFREDEQRSAVRSLRNLLTRDFGRIEGPTGDGWVVVADYAPAVARIVRVARDLAAAAGKE